MRGAPYRNDSGHGKNSTWKGGGVDTAGMTAAWAAAAAAAAAAVAGSGCTAMGLIMCSIVWILPSSIILGAGAAWNMEYWAPMAGMATAREAGRRQAYYSRSQRKSLWLAGRFRRPRLTVVNRCTSVLLGLAQHHVGTGFLCRSSWRERLGQGLCTAVS